ncbi:MAG: hypothetical protein Q7K03_05500, partial [Dehalococcoidia bacterium]|nr:hypothetical protein [Dehalococcoidia bacterium]
MTAGNVDPAGELSIGPEDASRPRRQLKGRGRLLLKGLVGLACVAYFATSAVVIVNAFVWLPSFPSGWYRM